MIVYTRNDLHKKNRRKQIFFKTIHKTLFFFLCRTSRTETFQIEIMSTLFDRKGIGHINKFLNGRFLQ